jgi:hypothetical protein
MFGFIRRWRQRKRLAQRALFRYHDGRQWRHADPAKIWRDLYSDPEIPDVAQAAAEADAGQEPQATKFHAFLCRIFDVEPFDPQTGCGLTIWEIHGILRDFEAYLYALKKSTNPSRMPWQLWALTEGSPAPAPSEPQTSSSPSSSSPDESNADGPTSSPEPSKSE